MAKCPSCGADVASPTKKWSMAGRPDKAGKRLRLDIGLFDCLIMKELIEKYNMRKIDASTRMELTPAAITQYLKGERGTALLNEIGRSGEAMKGISKLAEILAKNDVSIESVVEQLCNICETIRSEEIICELHQKTYQP